jgi:hypothetical protein
MFGSGRVREDLRRLGGGGGGERENTGSGIVRGDLRRLLGLKKVRRFLGTFFVSGAWSDSLLKF